MFDLNKDLFLYILAFFIVPHPFIFLTSSSINRGLRMLNT